MRQVDKSKPLSRLDYRYLRDGGDTMPRPLLVYADEDWTDVEISALKSRGAKFIKNEDEDEVVDASDLEEEEEEVEADVEDDYPEWSNADLREELDDRGLETKGNKPDLIERLRADDAEEG